MWAWKENIFKKDFKYNVACPKGSKAIAIHWADSTM